MKADVLFHVAASYTFWTPRPNEVYDSNLRGTENLLHTALEKIALGCPLPAGKRYSNRRVKAGVTS